MKIVLITNLYPPEIIGGAERHVQSDAQELSRKGHSITIITTSSTANHSINESTKDGIDIYKFRPFNMYAPYEHQDEPIWKKPIQHFVDLWNPHSYRKVNKILSKLSPDIIHIHNYGGLSGSIFSSAGTIPAPVIHTLHDYGSLHVRPSLFQNGSITEPGPLMKPYQRFNNRLIEKNVDQILAPSQFIIDKHHEYGMLENVSCERLQLGINTSRSLEKQSSGDNLRLLFVGQLTVNKGVDVLLDAIAQITSKHIECHILGKGPEKEALVQQASSDDRVTIHGFVSEEELERQYALADYTIVPSRWYDNSPMVIYESFARGTPVIGANIGGIPELIEEGETGYLFEPNNPESLSQVILKHSSDASKLIPNVKNKDVSIETHTEQLIEIYRNLTSSK